MTYFGKTTMPRREVIAHAKALVLNCGPAAVLNAPEECVRRAHAYDEGFPFADVGEEAVRQAHS